jgi:spermidine synthase
MASATVGEALERHAARVSARATAGRWRASQLLMVASGFAGLGYQVVWTQQSALWLGHESPAVLAVVAAFFGGLAVGAFALGSRIEKSAQPARWYAGCELVIAAWSLVLALAMSPFSAWVLSVTGAQPSPVWQWAVAFFGTFVLLLPATAAMGATLPAMERATAHMSRQGRSIATLYASNTFGAVIGVLAIAFWLAPELGLVRTTLVCVALNVACGVISLVLFPRVPAPVDNSSTGDARNAPAARAHAADSSPSSVQGFSIARVRDASVGRGLLVRLAITGLLGIGYEVLVVRVLSQVDENTVYTFAMLLAVYLIGTALGAAGYQRWLARHEDTQQIEERLLGALAAACLIGTASLWGAEHIKDAALQQFGASMSAAIAAETVLALIAFGPPTLVMGALFSHLSSRAISSGIPFGRALGVNTLGASAAPLVFGVMALPALGPKLAQLIVCAGYLMLTGWRAWRNPIAWVPASAIVALALIAPPLAFIEIPEGGRVISYQEGAMGAVSVVEDAGGVSRLRIDNRQQEGSSSTLRVDGRQGLLPVLLHPAPRRALFLGLGTGITASSAAEDPSLEVDAVELLPEVIEASAHFTHIVSGDKPNPRLHLIAADARRYVRASDRLYDVIVSDNFHPARSGSGSLYTVEHFAAVRGRLEAGGVFCQWLPLHQLDLQTLRSIVQSFISVYPNGAAMLASNSLETPVLGLIGREDNGRFDANQIRARLANAAIPDKLARIGIEDDLALLGGFVAGPDALKRFAGNAPANTDDLPIVAYRAPRITYMPDSEPRDRLITLLRATFIDPAELVAPAADAEWSRRLAAYWQARNRFIESGRAVRPSPDVRDMLDQVRGPLLSVLRTSPDFRPAYDPLVRMAAALAQIDPGGARALLMELERIQPARPEAALVLSQLGADSN